MTAPRVTAFDLETTGTDVDSDRIVSAAVVLIDEHGTVVQRAEWLINPGVPIPPGATEVHGITDELASAGMLPHRAIPQVLVTLDEFLCQSDALVIYNAPFDLTMLDRELTRYYPGTTLTTGESLVIEGEYMDGYVPLFDGKPIVDPLVLDKHFDRYRKGSRKLVDTAALLRIPLGDDAHGALADATAAGLIAQRMLISKTFPPSQQSDPAWLHALHDAQVRWYAEQAHSYADYLHSRGEHEKALTVTDEWPYRKATP